MRFFLTYLCISALHEGHTAHCSGVKVPYLFYAPRHEMLAATEQATLKILRPSRQSAWLIESACYSGRASLAARKLTCLLWKKVCCWGHLPRTGWDAMLAGATETERCYPLPHGVSGNFSEGEKVWNCDEKWWFCCYGCLNWKRKGSIPKPDDRALIKTTRKTSEVIKLWNPLRKLFHTDVLVTGNICPVQMSQKAIVF